MDVATLEAQGRAILTPAFRARRPSWVGGEISAADCVFLAGLVASTGARNVVEIGVASGWSSAVILHALESAGMANYAVNGIDLSPTFYLDASRPTGAAVAEMLPELEGHYVLHTGRLAYEVTPELGPIGLGFIDANHLHPWATLDLIALLPFLSAGAWVAMHDINLCRFPRHKHRNRGPFYLFGSWPGARLNSTEALPMIGAVLLERQPADYLDVLCEILATPWETKLSAETLGLLSSFVTVHFGPGPAEKFRECCTAGSAPH